MYFATQPTTLPLPERAEFTTQQMLSNNFVHSFNLPSRSHTIKTFLSSKIHFLERYVLLSKIVGHKITMNSKWLLYMVSSSQSKNSVFPQAVTPTNIAE